MSRGRRWKSHRIAGRLVAVVAFLIPIVASLAAVLAADAFLPPPVTASDRVLWWILILAAGMAPIPPFLYLARRLMPLAMLLRIGLLFPDQAPSRFQVAMRAHRTKDLKREVASHGDEVLDERMRTAAGVLALVAAVEEHDRTTRGHSERVRVFTDLIVAEMDMPDDDKEKLRWVALLHDVGKLSVPREILNKPGRPDADEWDVLQRHTTYGLQIMGPLRSWLGDWVSAVEQHHERYDGTGYPRGLAGENISLGGRIVAVADSYEVMTAARPYKKPMRVGEAREELVRSAGGQFDPQIVRTFLGISVGKLRWVVGIGALLAQIPVLSQLSYRGITQRIGNGAGAAAAAAAVVLAMTVAGPLQPTGLGPTHDGSTGTDRGIAAPGPDDDARGPDAGDPGDDVVAQNGDDVSVVDGAGVTSGAAESDGGDEGTGDVPGEGNDGDDDGEPAPPEGPGEPPAPPEEPEEPEDHLVDASVRIETPIGGAEATVIVDDDGLPVIDIDLF